jgi:hypothetical protein
MDMSGWLATRQAKHPEWCAGGHHCGLGEHRGEPLRIDVVGAGSLVVTRVRGGDGHDYAEVRGSLRLTNHEPRARHQLGWLIDGLVRLIWGAGRG